MTQVLKSVITATLFWKALLPILTVHVHDVTELKYLYEQTDLEMEFTMLKKNLIL